MNKTPIVPSNAVQGSFPDMYGAARYLKHLRTLWLGTKPSTETTRAEVFLNDLPSVKDQWSRAAADRDAQCAQGHGQILNASQNARKEAIDDITTCLAANKSILAREREPIHFDKLWNEEYEKGIKIALEHRGAVTAAQNSASDAILARFKQLYTAWRIMCLRNQQVMVDYIYTSTCQDYLMYRSLVVITGKISITESVHLPERHWLKTGFEPGSFRYQASHILAHTSKDTSKADQESLLDSFTQWWTWRCKRLRDVLSSLSPEIERGLKEECSVRLQTIGIFRINLLDRLSANWNARLASIATMSSADGRAPEGSRRSSCSQTPAHALDLNGMTEYVRQFLEK